MASIHPVASRALATLAAAALAVAAGLALALPRPDAAPLRAAPAAQGIQATGVVTLGAGTCFPDAVLLDCDGNVVAQMKGPGGAGFFSPYLGKYVRVDAAVQSCAGGDSYLSVVSIVEQTNLCGPAGTATAMAPTPTALPPATATTVPPPTATPSAPGQGGPGNRALGMPVQASSSQPGHPPEHAVDGDLATFWASNPGSDWNARARNTQWIYVDLGADVDVGEMRMRWGVNRHARGYSVHVWDEPRRLWITLGSTASGDGDDTWTVRGNVALRGRYFMLWLANPYIIGGHYELLEWEIAGAGAGATGGADNLARSRPIQALGADPAYAPANAVDGDLATEWRADALPTWIYVDLGTAQVVDRAVVRWSAGLHGTDYTLYVWNGAAWSAVYAQRAGRGGDETLGFRAVRTQYVLLYVAASAGPTVGVRELEVYPYGANPGGGGGGLVTPTPPLPPIPFAAAAPLGAGPELVLEAAGAPAPDDLGGPTFAPRALVDTATDRRIDTRAAPVRDLPDPRPGSALR